jgi:kumamolisin
MMMSSGASERTIVPGSERAEPDDSERRGVCDPAERAQVTIVLRPRARPPGAPDPAKPYPSRAAYARASGASPADIALVERFALDAALVVLESSAARRSVVIEGTLEALGHAFGTTMSRYERGDVTFRARTGTLSVPRALDGIVTGVFGIDTRPQARAQFRPASATATAYSAPAVARAYGFPTAVTGAGETIALVELGGGYAANDLERYFKSLGVAAPTVTSVSVDGATNAPTGSANGPDGEVELDIEVAGSIAPGAKIVVYFAPNTDRGFLDAVTTAIHDTANAPSIVSISWGGPESTWTAQATSAFDMAFADAAALGVTVTVAAGDNGSSDGVTTDTESHVDFPASSPHALACGGTTLRLSGATIESETVWNDGSSGGATGGGVSEVFALPAYQAGAGVPVADDSAGVPGRGVPDVCGNADPETGYAVVVDGNSTVIGGTSAVAPLWAGLIALLNERAGKRAGFINATLYANPHALRDVTSGSNGAYRAGPGWDACTGLGSPNGPALAALFPEKGG